MSSIQHYKSNKMSQQVSRLKYNWKFIEFWIIRTFIRLEQITNQQNETKGVCEVIMGFLRCELCFIGELNHKWYVMATKLNKLSVNKELLKMYKKSKMFKM